MNPHDITAHAGPRTAAPEAEIQLGEERIRTPRLVLVAAAAGLLRAELAGPEALAAALGARVPPDWPPELYDREANEYSLAAAEAAGGLPRWGAWYVVAPGGEPGGLVGMCGFHGPPTPEGVVEVGYALLPAARGRGHATEAVRGLLAYAWADPGVRRVIAETLPHLAASIRVMERAGFVPAADPSSPEVVRYELLRPGG